MQGRYPDFDVLAEADHWDEATRRVVLRRVAHPPPLRFFTHAEAAALGAFCDTVTAQDEEPRVPVLPYIDEKLHDGNFDGYQHADMPDDRDAWRLVARGLDEAARARGAESYGEGSPEMRREICAELAAGELRGGVWDDLPPTLAWALVMRAVLEAFYSHPWAWNEIGFGGPAYPRGYARLGIGQREAWEGEEAFSVDPVADVRARGVE